MYSPWPTSQDKASWLLIFFFLRKLILLNSTSTSQLDTEMPSLDQWPYLPGETAERRVYQGRRAQRDEEGSNGWEKGRLSRAKRLCSFQEVWLPHSTAYSAVIQRRRHFLNGKNWTFIWSFLQIILCALHFCNREEMYVQQCSTVGEKTRNIYN